MWVAFYIDSFCICFSVGCAYGLVLYVDCCFSEQQACYVDADWFLNVDLFGMWILLVNLSRGL